MVYDIFNALRTKILKQKPSDLLYDDKTGYADFRLFIDGFGQYGKLLRMKDEIDFMGRQTIQCKIAPSPTMIRYYDACAVEPWRPIIMKRDEHGDRYLVKTFLKTSMVELNSDPTAGTYQALHSMNNLPSPLINKLKYFEIIREVKEENASLRRVAVDKTHLLNLAHENIYRYVERNVDLFKKAFQVRGKSAEQEEQIVQQQGDITNG